MSSSWLATVLDQEQIENRKGEISGRMIDVERLDYRTGTRVAEELGSRYVLRYLGLNRLTDLLGGSREGHWVTPTPISPEEASRWLALPDPQFIRKHALILDLTKIEHVCGPAWIKLGQGIEYFLPTGFPKDAIVDSRVVEVW